MKTIFTLLSISACILFPVEQAISQNCNYALGGNGVSSAFGSAITIDGNMADWAPYLSDPDNNSYDNTSSTDLDAPISDAGRDLARFTFTEDANNLYIYLQRAGSTNNSVDMVFYADIDNDGSMELNEPVIHINWSGSNGNVSVSSNNYIPSITSLLNSITANLDGSSLWGTLLYRSNIGQTGRGSADGKSVEIKIPFTQLTQLGILGNVIKQLSFGQDFKFHISTINGNISSIPGLNSINDNFGGCLKAPAAIILPVKLTSFAAMLSTNSKVDLKWTTANEINISHFIIEKSTDGKNFNDAGMVFANGSTNEKMNYIFSDNINASQSSVIYYRLRSVDVDGKSQYSDTRVIRISKQTENAITVVTYPNPVSNELRVTIPNNWQNRKVTYEMFNSNGQVSMKSETINSSQTENINVSSLASGFYFVKVTCDGQFAQQKIIKK